MLESKDLKLFQSVHIEREAKKNSQFSPKLHFPIIRLRVDQVVVMVDLTKEIFIEIDSGVKKKKKKKKTVN
jgi:hypothetical protein